MFDEMITLLKEAKLLPEELLRQRFDAGLIKKMGVMKMPYIMWQQDRKINPDSKEMLWATIVLEDPESFSLVASIIANEEYEIARAKGKESPAGMKEKIDSLVDELLDLAPDLSFRGVLELKIGKARKV